MASEATPHTLAHPWLRPAPASRPWRGGAWLVPAAIALGLAAAHLAPGRGDPQPAPPYARAAAKPRWPAADRRAFVGDCDAAGRSAIFCRCLADAYQLRWRSYAEAMPAIMAADDAAGARARCREYAREHDRWLARHR